VPLVQNGIAILLLLLPFFISCFMSQAELGGGLSFQECDTSEFINISQQIS
jgi:hypothetical protein